MLVEGVPNPPVFAPLIGVDGNGENKDEDDDDEDDGNVFDSGVLIGVMVLLSPLVGLTLFLRRCTSLPSLTRPLPLRVTTPLLPLPLPLPSYLPTPLSISLVTMLPALVVTTSRTA